MIGELNVTDVFNGLGQTMRLRVIKKTVVNFEAVETEQATKIPLWFTCVAHAMRPRDLLVKPEGQRQWKWWDMWTTEHLELDWELEDQGRNRFRVMSRQDWSQAGFFRYEIQEGPTP